MSSFYEQLFSLSFEKHRQFVCQVLVTNKLIDSTNICRCLQVQSQAHSDSHWFGSSDAPAGLAEVCPFLENLET